MKYILFLLIIFSSNFVKSQVKAVTENGDEVLLFPDKSWEYVNSEIENEEKEIKINTTKYSKNSKSTFIVKSSKIDIGIYLDPTKWNFKKATHNDEAEFEFNMKNRDLYALLITESIEIPIENLKNIALINGRSVAPNLKIVNEEYRTVNNLRVLHLEMQGTLEGIDFTYYGYYYSDENGTIQFLTYSSKKLMKELKNECEELLNGFVVLKN
jgi:hypothetical protein